MILTCRECESYISSDIEKRGLSCPHCGCEMPITEKVMHQHGLMTRNDDIIFSIGCFFLFFGCMSIWGFFEGSGIPIWIPIIAFVISGYGLSKLRYNNPGYRSR